MNTPNRQHTLTALFSARYGVAPEIWCRAPGRVDLMGSHTDYNEGHVLTCTISRDTWIAARARGDGRVRLYSTNMVDAASFDWNATDAAALPKWAVYAWGVGRILARAGHKVTGCDAVIDGTIPLGSGLSSSASLEVAFAVLQGQLGGYQLDPVAVARLCQQAENEFVGVQCGILDQYSSACGARHAVLLLDCRHLTSTKAAFPKDIGLVLANTCVPRELAGSEYGRRRADCEAAAAILARAIPGTRTLRDVSPAQFLRHRHLLSGAVVRRAQFIVEENTRVAELAVALERNDKPSIGRLAAASFAGASWLYEITVPAMHAMMRAMLAGPGVIGARQSGAGFGGCMAAYVEKARVDEFCAFVGPRYQQETGIKPDIYSLHTSDGAGPVDFA